MATGSESDGESTGGRAPTLPAWKPPWPLSNQGGHGGLEARPHIRLIHMNTGVVDG